MSYSSLHRLLGGDFVDATGCHNDIEFWSRFSGITKGTAADHMSGALRKNGYPAHLGDAFRQWANDVGGKGGTVYDNLRGRIGLFQPGLTFFKDYSNLPVGTVTQAQLNATLSVGSGVASFTCAGDATHPRTYVDGNGVIQLVTDANVGRIQGGYYDATGFHAQKGLMVEAAGMNYALQSTDLTSYAKVSATITADQFTAPDNSLADEVNITANGGFIRKTGGTGLSTGTYTLSGWVRKSDSGGSNYVRFTTNDSISWNTGFSGQLAITTTWARFSVTGTLTTVGGGVNVMVGGAKEDASADNQVSGKFLLWGLQLEASPSATSFIPTVDQALDRPKETLLYETAGNRTAASETFFVKLAPFGFKVGGDSSQFISDTDTKARFLYFNAGNSKSFSSTPNASDSASCTATQTVDLVENTSSVLASSINNSISPYIALYKDGSANGTEIADTYTNNAWGTYFWIGSTRESGAHLNGIIQSVAIFSDAKAATPVAAITNLM